MNIRVTSSHPHFLAHEALVHKLHTKGLLWTELTQLLKGVRHDIALVYVDHKPVCVALYAEYGQLMVYTKPSYRRRGLASRASRLLARRTGVKLKMMTGELGNVPSLSLAFFNSLGVDLSGVE